MTLTIYVLLLYLIAVKIENMSDINMNYNKLSQKGNGILVGSLPPFQARLIHCPSFATPLTG